MLLAVPAFLTSCQEDAPEINYTMSVSVINDFTKVVEAIDRGALKNEEAIAKFADAIDRMSSDQQAIRDVLGSVNTALETRLIAIEAALKAQTLSLVDKLDLLEAAVNALPDYGSQLAAISTAIATCLPPATAENPGSAMSAGVTTGRVRTARPTATTPATSTSVRADTTGTSIPRYYGFSVRPVRP